MAAYAALVSLMNTIQDIHKHPQISTFFDRIHTQTLFEKTSLLLDFIEADNYGKEAEDLEREITSAAQAAEEAIDFYIMDQIYAETSETSLDLQQKIRSMDVVLINVNEFKGKPRSGEKQHTPVLELEIEETVMVGLDAEFESLLDELTRDPQSNRKTISIVGMGGMGKTTLAKNIFENQLIKEHFDFRAWATISQQHNAQEIIAQLISHSKNSSHQSVNELGENLHKNLFGRRYLIILDDIWSVKAWDEVSLFFPDNKNGSQILLTTRLSNVANDCGSSPFMMRFLDEDNSWKLFCEKAFKNESCPPELREMGEEIVKLCKGLALSIVVIGGLLSKSPRIVEYWKSIVRDIKSISGGSLDVLSLSYHHLPAHLKPCFIYMGVFEEDYEIHVSEVVRLWIAEGFIKPSGCGVLEEIGKGYIKDMIDRNLILVRRWYKNGKIGCCGIHDLLRDLCIKLGEQQQFFSQSQRSNPTKRCLISEIVNLRKHRFPRARSILASSLYGQPIKRGLLRVLKTQSEVKSPAKLYGNVNLRHLAYEQNIGGTSWELPTSVSLVWNLQTLIIRVYSFNSVVVAPPEIWKMRQLRHVDFGKFGKIYLPPYNRPDEDELLILENLQTLKTVVNPRLCMEVCEIIPNIIKLYLCYDESLYEYDDCLIEYLCNLDRMHKLESLKLVIFNNKLNKRPILASSLSGQPIKQGLLRVLKSQSHVNSAAYLYENVNLRHLAYQENMVRITLWELPTSVSLMWNLQTLIIQVYTLGAVVVAPKEIWKMRQLRHVVCGNIYLPPYNRQDEDELLILENLRTLKTVVNPRLCMEVCEIIPNIIKLYLFYHASFYGYDDCLNEYLCNLNRLHKLEYLNMVVNCNKLNNKPTFPNSLKRLSLDGCGFNWDGMVMIGSLPQLEVLILFNSSVVGDEWSPSTGQFLNLKFLKLDGIDFKYWDADDSHFPVLEKLLLCSLDYLEEIPLGIGDIPTLELIRVEYCTNSVEISALKIKEDQLDNGNDTLQIQICVYDDDEEDFKERVEFEGLSISNIQLET